MNTLPQVFSHVATCDCLDFVNCVLQDILLLNLSLVKLNKRVRKSLICQIGPNRAESSPMIEVPGIKQAVRNIQIPPHQPKACCAWPRPNVLSEISIAQHPQLHP